MSAPETAEHYNAGAREYEQKWQGYLDHTHTKMLDVLLPDLTDEDVILDASCGTGLLAEQLLEKNAPFRELVLNDISPRMLGVAHERLPEDHRISFTAYPADAPEFEDNRFTKIVCLNALHNYDQPGAAIKHFHKMLQPNGRLYLLDWNRITWFRLLNPLIRFSGRETINTLNLKEVTEMLDDEEFRIRHTEQWHYRYWQLYIVIAGL